MTSSQDDDIAALTLALKQEKARRKKAERELKWQSYLVQYNPNTFIITDTEGRIEFVNSVFTSLTGYTYHEVIGHKIDEFSLHNLSADKNYSWDALLEGDVFEGEVSSWKKNGERFYEQVFLLPITNEENEVSRIAFIKRDITPRKTVEKDLLQTNKLLIRRVNDLKYAERELAHLNTENELILNSVSEGIFGVDLEGSITFMNPAAQNMMGYTSAELIGHRCYVFIVPPDGEGESYDMSDCPVTASLQYGQIGVSEEEVFFHRNGSSFSVELASAPIVEDDVVIGAVVTFRDITEQLQVRKAKEQVERELRDLTETLEQQVTRRTAQLSATNQDLLNTLDQLQKAQAQLVQSEKMASLGGLVAGVAHEINTPVGIGYTATTHLEKVTRQIYRLYNDGRMKRKDLEDYMDTCVETTSLLLSNLNRASELISSFKQVAIDQSGEAKRSFNVCNYLDEILLSLRPLLKNTLHQVEVDCPESLELVSYPGALSQVLTNLITNSVTHGYDDNQAGLFRIEIAMKNNELRLSYSDDGCGIEADELPRIFDPFFTTGSEKGGSGLGLHIVYNIITQQLNGSIFCKSTPGQGTAFIIKILV
jgi:PAS domain S-box-containing protein